MATFLATFSPAIYLYFHLNRKFHKNDLKVLKVVWCWCFGLSIWSLARCLGIFWLLFKNWHFFPIFLSPCAWFTVFGKNFLGPTLSVLTKFHLISFRLWTKSFASHEYCSYLFLIANPTANVALSPTRWQYQSQV